MDFEIKLSDWTWIWKT